jgi:hypothetical protein
MGRSTLIHTTHVGLSEWIGLLSCMIAQVERINEVAQMTKVG